MQLRSPSPDVAYHPIDIVESSTFGKSKDINASRTFNMIQSDDWIVNYSGYKKEIIISEIGQGRGIFTSSNSNSFISVINDSVYAISLYSTGPSGHRTYSTRKVGTISTISGDVFIDENNASQIAISDQVNLYIYNYATDTFQMAILPDGVVPGNVTFHNGRFVIPDKATNQWFLSAPNDGLNWFWGDTGAPVIGAIQTKPDKSRVTIRFPGRSDLLLVMGQNVSELQVDIGALIFPYQKNTSVSFDYGCLNAATVAASEEIIAWLGSNEKSEPVLMYTNGSDIKTISTDGINEILQSIVNPEKSSAFFVKVLGHLIYQLTFYDEKDNYSFIYDFTTGKFFDVTDQDMNYHIARRVALYQGEYYFVSLNDGCIYIMNSDIPVYNYGVDENNNPIEFEIPRIRVCSNFRLPNSKRFIVTNVSLTMQQGNDPNNIIPSLSYQPRISLSVSRDGGITFGSSSSIPLNPLGVTRNRVEWWKLGAANNLVLQFRFHGKGQWNAFTGVMGVRQ